MLPKVSYAHQGCFYLIKSTVIVVILLLQIKELISVFENVIYSYDGKAKFGNTNNLLVPVHGFVYSDVLL